MSDTTNARTRLVKTALSLIDRQGYCATGLNQIIEESKTPKGSLYHYFPRGKEQLAQEAIRTTGDASAQWIEACLAEDITAASAFFRLIHSLADHVESLGCCGGGPVAAVAIEAASSNEALRRTCAETYAQWRQHFANKLTASSFPVERAQSIALFIQSAIEGAVILCRTEGTVLPLRTLAGEIERFLGCEAIPSSTNHR